MIDRKLYQAWVDYCRGEEDAPTWQDWQSEVPLIVEGTFKLTMIAASVRAAYENGRYA